MSKDECNKAFASIRIPSESAVKTGRACALCGEFTTDDLSELVCPECKKTWERLRGIIKALNDMGFVV